jgi:hypothetical protein
MIVSQNQDTISAISFVDGSLRAPGQQLGVDHGREHAAGMEAAAFLELFRADFSRVPSFAAPACNNVAVTAQPIDFQSVPLRAHCDGLKTSGKADLQVPPMLGISRQTEMGAWSGRGGLF